MRSYLINKNLSLFYFLRRMIGKKPSIAVASTIERAILIFGREELPRNNDRKIPTKELKSE